MSCAKAKRLKERVKDDLGKLRMLQVQLESASSQRMDYVREERRRGGSVLTPTGMARPSVERARMLRAEIAKLQDKIVQSYAEGERLWKKNGCVGDFALAGASRRRSRRR